MKKLLISLGAFLLILIFVGAAFLGYEISLARKADATSCKYVDDVIPKIVSHWSKEIFFLEASSELLQIVSKDQVQQLFSQCQQLGKFLSSKPAQGSSFVSLRYPQGKKVTAYYEKEVTFERGKTKIRTNLIQKEETWKLASFYVDTPVFTESTNTFVF